VVRVETPTVADLIAALGSSGQRLVAAPDAAVLVTTDGPAREFVPVLAETGVQLTPAPVAAEGIDLDALRHAFPGF
jgi:hypothetical protein